MAVDFPPNLDDGELWLPSEIYTDVGVCSRRHRQSSAALLRDSPSDLGYMDDLAQQIAAFRLLDRNEPFSPDLFLHGRPLARFAVPAAGRAVSGAGTGAFFPDPPFKPGKPVLCQKVDGFGLGRPRVLQRKLSRGQNRFIPPGRLVGLRRECGGTGVFLPRATVNNDTSKKQSTVKGGEQQREKRSRNAAVMKKQMVSLESPSEMGLPQDWAY